MSALLKRFAAAIAEGVAKAVAKVFKVRSRVKTETDTTIEIGGDDAWRPPGIP